MDLRSRIFATIAAAVLCSGALLGARTTGAGQGNSSGSSESPTFNKTIAPIIFDHCGICHRPGGDAPFSLLTYAAVHQRATLITAAIARGQMPPGTAESDYGEFTGLRKLSASEFASIRRWIGAGMPE